jgi:hypothetical protein
MRRFIVNLAIFALYLAALGTLGITMYVLRLTSDDIVRFSVFANGSMLALAFIALAVVIGSSKEARH